MSRAHDRSMARRVGGTTISMAAHVGVLLAILNAPGAPPLPPPEIMQVTLEPPPVPPAPEPTPVPTPAPDPVPSAQPKPSAAAPRQPAPTPTVARRPPPPIPAPDPLPAETSPSVPVNVVSDARLAGAATAGSGAGSGSGAGAGGGGGCNMIQLLEDALRGDRMVHNAVAQARASGAAGRNIMMWDGGWVRTRGEEGKGLAAVRQAIMWKVGFSSPACRNARVQGLVVISLGDGPGATRIVVGQGQWRWQDLLT